MKGNQIMNNNTALDWDSVIEDDSEGFRLLPEGDYIGRIAWMDKGHHNGSKKIPPCPKAIVNISLETPNGITDLTTNLLLHYRMEWKLSEFFRAIGQKKKGERLVMDWNAVQGAPIAVHVRQRTYTNANGEERTINDIDKFLEFDPSRFPADPNWLEEAMVADSEEELKPLDEVL